MRKIREITAKEENFRDVPIGSNCAMIKRDPIETEPIGTIVLMPFVIMGYTPDCDGSLMAKLENINIDSETTGWYQDSIGLYPTSGFVVTKQELKNII